MAITLTDCLFYCDLRQSVVPLVGGQPTFTRNGTAFGSQLEAFERVHAVDTPRIGKDGLMLELAGTNEMGDDPFDPGSYFVGNASKADAVSIYEGKTASLITPAASDGRITTQSGITLSGAVQSIVADIESTDLPTATRLRLEDTTNNDVVLSVQYNWRNGAVTVSGTASSNRDGGVYKKHERGPNGGEVFCIWGVVTANNANDGRLVFYPDASGSNDAAVVHYMGQHDSSRFTSAVDGTRASEKFGWNSMPPPQPMAIYARWRHLIVDNGGASFRRVWSNESTSGVDPAAYVDYPSTGNIRFAYVDASGNLASSTSTKSLRPGDIVEIICLLFADGKVRLLIRVNGGSVTDGGLSSAPAGGLASAWHTPSLWLNSHGGGGLNGVGQYQRWVAAKLNAITAPTDGSDNEALMRELSGLYAYVGSDGIQMSNVT